MSAAADALASVKAAVEPELLPPPGADAVERELAAVPQADAQAELSKLIGTPAELFPGMEPERAEFYHALLAFHCIGDLDGNQCHAWWEQLTERERVYLCRLASVERERAAVGWFQLADKERAQLVAKFMWLYEWTHSTNPPVWPYRLPAFVR